MSAVIGENIMKEIEIIENKLSAIISILMKAIINNNNE